MTIENGSLKSEIDHLESELKKALKKIDLMDPVSTRDKRINQKNKRIKKQDAELERLRKSVTELSIQLNKYRNE